MNLARARSQFFLLACAVVALGSLAACGDDNNLYADQYDPAQVIEVAPVPPPPSDEVRGIAQDPRNQVWRPGHWVYQDQHFVWVPGEIITRPLASAVWSQDRWEHRSYGWVFIHGYWQ